MEKLLFPGESILVVDDERNIRRALEMILSGEGYGVVCAGDGKEALRQVEQVLGVVKKV